jgi:hypothetical protein
LIDSGMASAIVGEVHDEICARTLVAQNILGDAIEQPATPASLHLWLPMGELEAERAAGRAMRAGLLLMPPGAGAINGDAETGLRVSLGAVGERAHLLQALTLLRDALTGEVGSHARSLI